jgi:hypothetical protein
MAIGPRIRFGAYASRPRTTVLARAAGTRLVPYEISGAVDTGDMGEVYRAPDTRRRSLAGGDA